MPATLEPDTQHLTQLRKVYEDAYREWLEGLATETERDHLAAWRRVEEALRALQGAEQGS